jgi:hypothetical protein
MVAGDFQNVVPGDPLASRIVIERRKRILDQLLTHETRAAQQGFAADKRCRDSALTRTEGCDALAAETRDVRWTRTCCSKST